MYRRLLELWMQELEERKLQTLSDKVLAEIQEYLNLLKEKFSEEGIQAELSKVEYERAQAIIARLTELKLRKALEQCKEKSELKKGAALGVEKKFLKAVIELLANMEREEKEERREEIEEKPREERVVVRFLKDVPSFIGVDLKTYGPFKSEDVALIPVQNAEALARRGLVKIVRREET